MKCRKAGILISALADGELSPREQSALERHISACAACAREMQEIAELRRDMAVWADEAPSEWLAQNFSHKLQELTSSGCAPVTQKARLRWGVLGPATAVFATAMLLIVIVLHNQTPPPVTREAAKSHRTAAQQAENARASNPQAIQEAAQGAGQTLTAERDVIPPKIVRHRHPRVHVAVRPARSTDVKPTTDLTGPATGYAAPGSLGGHTGPTPGDNIADRTTSGVAPIAGADEVKYSLGEAGLAMNETVERLRGTLQQAVDLLVSKPPLPANGGTESHGGDIL